MKTRIREARPDEYDEVGRLSVDSYQEYSAALGAERWEGYRERLADVAGRAAESTILVAEDVRGDIVGAVALYHDSRNEKVEWPRRWAVIKRLAVSPNSRGAGVGRLIVGDCIRRAREAGAPAIALRTIDLMGPAISLYRSMGFEELPEYRQVRPGVEIEAWALRLDGGHSGV
jgi:predicted N-acetyltransferase YhbS